MGARGKPHNRTVGGYALSRAGKDQSQIGRELGVSKVTVHHWINGGHRPAEAMRARICALYGIEPDAWDREHKAAPPPLAIVRPLPVAPPERDPDGGDDDEAMQMARALQRQVRLQLDQLESEGGSWSAEKNASVMAKLSTSVNVLAKTTGQYELGRRILTLPIWKKIEAEIFAALKDYPEAAASVAERLEAFERAWLGKVG